MPAAAWRLGIANPQSIKRLGHFLTADNISAGTPNGGKGISGATGISVVTEKRFDLLSRGICNPPYSIDMLAAAWLLGIANPQSIKRLGHYLTADNISAGTPNGGRAYPVLRKPCYQSCTITCMSRF